MSGFQKHKAPGRRSWLRAQFQFYISTLTFPAGRSTKKVLFARVSADCAKVCAIPASPPSNESARPPIVAPGAISVLYFYTNLSHWPSARVEALRCVLRDEAVAPA